jgi:hypothetical protein
MPLTTKGFSAMTAGDVGKARLGNREQIAARLERMPAHLHRDVPVRWIAAHRIDFTPFEQPQTKSFRCWAACRGYRST